MRYVKKLPQTDSALSQTLLAEGWKKLKEPSNLLTATLLSLPLSVLLVGVILFLAYLLDPNLFSLLEGGTLRLEFRIDLRLALFLVVLWGYMFLHEMIHAVFIPNFIRSENTVWGLNGVFGFVFTTEPICKARFLMISCMPFVLLSVAALFFFYSIHILNGYTLALCVINAAGSCVDFLNIILVGVQVRRRATIINNGFETFYK